MEPLSASLRGDGRRPDEPRQARIIPNYQDFAEGSVMIEIGMTKVICAASLEERVPPFMRGKGEGWVTAEYGMLPRSTNTRSPREGKNGEIRGRSVEIQRLIGRSLRAITNRHTLGERTVIIDCDVIQADGGTRTAAITGAYVALYQALLTLVASNMISEIPLRGAVAAMSVGIVERELLLDLSYEEDFKAQADFNVVMTDQQEMVEIQGAAEGYPFSKQELPEIIDLAQNGIDYMFTLQKEAIRSIMDSGH